VADYRHRKAISVLQDVYIGSGNRPVSYPVGTGGCFVGNNGGWNVKLNIFL
jgi:hypothetical protein